MLCMVNDEDRLVADAVQRVLPSVAAAVESIVERLGYTAI